MAKKRHHARRRPKKWIQAAIGTHRGALHRALHLTPREKISLETLHALERKGGKNAKRAYLAETLRKLRKKKRHPKRR